MSGVAALILAGSRPGGDPLARENGVSAKARIEIAGRPMLHHVADALLAVPRIGRIAVSGTEPLPLFGDRMAMVPAGASPSLSVGAALSALGTPLLVTTADHPLLEPEWIEHFLDHLPPASAVAGLARAETVAEAAPGTKRTYLRFSGSAWSGCNLFYFADPGALGVVDFWRRIERHRKRPWRMAGLIGAGAILSHLTGRLTLDGALRLLEMRTGTRLGIVDMPFGEAAVDVDKASDLAFARNLMEARATGRAIRAAPAVSAAPPSVA